MKATKVILIVATAGLLYLPAKGFIELLDDTYAMIQADAKTAHELCIRQWPNTQRGFDDLPYQGCIRDYYDPK